MSRIIRIDDSTLKGLIDATELWNDFPKFEKLSQRYKLAPKTSCRCRGNGTKNVAPILAEARAYIHTMPPDKKTLIKKYLNADYVKLTVIDITGRHSEFTF